MIIYYDVAVQLLLVVLLKKKKIVTYVGPLH